MKEAADSDSNGVEIDAAHLLADHLSPAIAASRVMRAGRILSITEGPQIPSGEGLIPQQERVGDRARDPRIQALRDRLPAAGPFPYRERKEWMSDLRSAFNAVYGDPEPEKHAGVRMGRQVDPT